ncbi:hypothetical protein MHC_01520 [Mycoplasma haemocanis str. Illinois]|uniref:Uncharacterized protein n=1 Tax=Mycoplasma haemocanis (strain Illinois) TaxID=1111676 RepID=H6N698_MYCHN|nr:hypothetical protein [Mycoplasma haemocanis]AEW45170.1 hypothetical protein MHC_01520 [Mycoplasma haemocanis str. Illinois]
MDIKLLGIIGSLGAVATGGGVYLAFKEKQTSVSISELFKQEKGVKLMTADDDDAKWNEAWIKYRDDHKITGDTNYEDEDKWGISNWKEKRSGENAFEEFKQECHKRSKVVVKDTQTQEYKDVKKYCSRPKKVSELLAEEGSKSPLDKDKDTDLWNQSWKDYKKVNAESGDGSTVKYKATDTWNIPEWASKQKEGSAPSEYKTTCETKLNSYIVPDKAFEDETFKQVVSWCTK